MRSGGRVVEGARLESEYRSKAYRGFESHPLRQVLIPHSPDPFFTSQLCCGFERRFGSLCVPQDPVRHFCQCGTEIYDYTYEKHFERACEAQGKVEKSEEHTSELQSLMRISYAVFCLQK